MTARWFPILITAVIGLGLTQVTIPGLNPDAVAYMHSTNQGEATTLLMPYMIMWLVLFRGLRALSRSYVPNVSRFWPGAYLLMVIWSSRGLINALEIMGVALEPGWFFRINALLTLGAAAALLWLLANWITRTAQASGPLVVLGLHTLYLCIPELVAWNAAYREGEATPIFDLLPVVGAYNTAPFWALAIGACSIRIRNLKWPVRIREGAVLHSAIDWLTLPLVLWYGVFGRFGEAACVLCAALMGLFLHKKST